MPAWESALHGCWQTQDGSPTAVIDIQKRQVKFLRDDEIGTLHVKGEDTVWCELGRFTYAAKHENGMLKWDNGEIWMLPEAMRQITPTSTSPSTPSAVPRVPTRSIAKFFNGIQDGEPLEYRVLQGVVFKKPNPDPASEKVLKKVQAVGSTMRTTGRIWLGKHECEWVELDNADAPGWVLVQGQGVGMPGPLLQKVDPFEDPPMVLRVSSPVAIMQDPDDDAQSPKERKFVMKPTASMTEVKAWISLLFRLHVAKLRILKPEDQRPSSGKYVVWHNRGDDEFVPDSWSLSKAGFRDGDLVEYTCLGFEEESDSN